MTSHGCFRAVTEVRATSSLHQLSEKMSQITNDFGFDSFAIVKRDPSNLYVEPAVLTNFTDVDQTCDPAFGPGTYALIEHAEESLTPFWWSTNERPFPEGQSAKTLRPEICNSEIGLIVPVPDCQDIGAGGFVAFAIAKDTGAEMTLPPFSMQIAFHAFHQASRLWTMAAQIPQLTNLQRNVIVQLAHGRPYPVIAQMLDRKTNQISNEVANLRRRYRVSTPEQIVMHALKERAVRLNELICS